MPLGDQMRLGGTLELPGWTPPCRRAGSTGSCERTVVPAGAGDRRTGGGMERAAAVHPGQPAADRAAGAYRNVASSPGTATSGWARPRRRSAARPSRRRPDPGAWTHPRSPSTLAPPPAVREETDLPAEDTMIEAPIGYSAGTPRFEKSLGTSATRRPSTSRWCTGWSRGPLRSGWSARPTRPCWSRSSPPPATSRPPGSPGSPGRAASWCCSRPSWPPPCAVPLHSSSLLQLPMVHRMVGPDRTVGVLVADAAALTPRHLAAIGAQDVPIRVAGMADAPEFREVMLEGRRDALDVDRLAARCWRGSTPWPGPGPRGAGHRVHRPGAVRTRHPGPARGAGVRHRHPHHHGHARLAPPHPYAEV